MKLVFVDTVYWIAVARPDDQFAIPAARTRASLGEVHLVTTEEVLTEFLAALSSGGRSMRRRAVEMVESILADRNTTVLPQTHESFLKGLHLYAARLDKKYSLVDRISMNAMKDSDVREVLTDDHHFAQEGLLVLLSP